MPSLAAELWGIPLDQVLGEIRAGAVVSKKDYGFTVVDVAPDSRELAPPPVRQRAAAPITYMSAGTLEEAEEVATDMAGHMSAEAEVAADAMVPAVSAMLLPTSPATSTPVAAIEPAHPNGHAFPPPTANDDDESEDGPDPNYGEPDDGKPLDWRAARAKSAMKRRRPPTRFN